MTLKIAFSKNPVNIFVDLAQCKREDQILIQPRIKPQTDSKGKIDSSRRNWDMCGGFFMEALGILNVSVYLYNTDAATSVHVSFFYSSYVAD